MNIVDCVTVGAASYNVGLLAGEAASIVKVLAVDKQLKETVHYNRVTDDTAQFVYRFGLFLLFFLQYKNNRS